MALDETVKIPKWVRGALITIGVGALAYGVDAINANTKAVSDLTVTITKVASSVDLVRSDTQGTLGRLIDVVEDMKKENEKTTADFEQRLRRLENGR